MFRDSIRGLDKIFKTDIDHTIALAIVGEGGTMKSSFSYSLIASQCLREDTLGIYITLEEGSSSLHFNLKSLGIPVEERLKIVDYNSLRRKFRGEEKHLAFLRMILSIIISFKRQNEERFKYVVIDSLGALYSLVDIADPRREMYHFFNTLRENDLTTVIIMERIGLTETYAGAEAMLFLVDGVIELGVVETTQNVRRYVQVKKMRAVKHDMEKFVLDIGDDGLEVLGPLYGY
ncbi:MAG: hypothetical protein L0Z54_00085 [Thermoplasmata archaeon]|nr:hypothetical protein [Thermoplasmata archaeon]